MSQQAIVSNASFRSSRNGLRQLVVDAGTGSATLQAQAGDGWITVLNGVISTDQIITFYAVSDQEFRVTLAGDAAAWISG